MTTKRLMFLGSIFLLLGLQGCSSGNFYLKTVAAKDAKITSNIKIAVIPENWYWLGVSNFFPRALVTEFLDLGFTVVERSQLEEVFKELKLSASGAVKEDEKTANAPGVDFGVLDKTSIKKIGDLLGVNAILLTYIVPTMDDEVSKATFRLVDVETAQVLFSITFINSSDKDNGKKILKPGGAVPTKKIIEAISLSIEHLLKGEKRISGEMGALDVKVEQIKGNKRYISPDNVRVAEPEVSSTKQQTHSTQESSSTISEKKVYMKDGAVVVGKSIVIEAGNLKVDSSHGMLTLPVTDVLKIE